MPTYQQHPSSFRDPSGFVFEAAGKLYRQINLSYAEHYDLLMQSGLYEHLVKQELLVSHVEINSNGSSPPGHYKTILPQFISFISYPYEWCFEQLQDAALLTLQILRSAIAHNMILKDATPYNVQFHFGKPVFIDTLSFEKYDEHQPWVAYRQFCETFLYPLVVSKYSGIEAHRLYLAYPDGMPAPTVAAALPAKARLKLTNWLHVFLPASVSTGNKQKQSSFNKVKLLRIIDHLEQAISALKPHSANKSVWDRYYEEEILNEQYLSRKKDLITAMVKDEDKNVIDLGCNRGLFSRLIASSDKHILAVDDNAYSISMLYRETKQNRTPILPLCVDLMQPPGDAGFGNSERKAFYRRIRFDLCICLALIHHLCISKNVPFEKLAEFLAQLADRLIIEFVPKEDEKALLLLSHRSDIFGNYNRQHFESSFSKYYLLENSKEIEGSARVIYQMKRK